MKYINNKNLSIEKVRFYDIAKRFGTPAYCYSYKQLKDNNNNFKKSFNSFSPLICFAIKSNTNVNLIREIRKFGLGADVVSMGELKMVGVFVFLILILFAIFRSVRWIMIPLFGCIISVIFVSGFSGFIDWRITVISSNFAAILLIITMSMTIHLAVRYREIKSKSLDLNNKKIVHETIHYMFVPCVYTSLTTIVAFASLVVSGIRPVIDFGHMMTLGITSAFIITFIVFPTILIILPNENIQERNDITRNITNKFASFSIKNNGKIVLISFKLK